MAKSPISNTLRGANGQGPVDHQVMFLRRMATQILNRGLGSLNQKEWERLAKQCKLNLDHILITSQHPEAGQRFLDVAVLESVHQAIAGRLATAKTDLVPALARILELKPRLTRLHEATPCKVNPPPSP